MKINNVCVPVSYQWEVSENNGQQSGEVGKEVHVCVCVFVCVWRDGLESTYHWFTGSIIQHQPCCLGTVLLHYIIRTDKHMDAWAQRKSVRARVCVHGFAYICLHNWSPVQSLSCTHTGLLRNIFCRSRLSALSPVSICRIISSHWQLAQCWLV